MGDNHRQEGVEISEYSGPARRSQQIATYSSIYQKPDHQMPSMAQTGYVWITAWSLLSALCTILMAACWLYGSLLGSWADRLFNLVPYQNESGESMVGGIGFWLAGISLISAIITFLLRRHARHPKLVLMISVTVMLITVGVLVWVGGSLFILAMLGTM